MPGKPGRYMLEITYHIQQQDSRGTLKGYGGLFNSYGLVDLRDPNNMVGLVRYTGEIFSTPDVLPFTGAEIASCGASLRLFQLSP